MPHCEYSFHGEKSFFSSAKSVMVLTVLCMSHLPFLVTSISQYLIHFLMYSISSILRNPYNRDKSSFTAIPLEIYLFFAGCKFLNRWQRLADFEY